MDFLVGASLLHSYETTFQLVSLNGFDRTETRFAFSALIKYAILMHYCSASTSGDHGYYIYVEQNLKCWKTPSNKLCWDITICLVTINRQLHIPYSLALCIIFLQHNIAKPMQIKLQILFIFSKRQNCYICACRFEGFIWSSSWNWVCFVAEVSVTDAVLYLLKACKRIVKTKNNCF